MRSISAVFFVLAMLSPAVRAEDVPLDARITSVSGSVTVYTSDEPNGVDAEEGMPLEAGDKIVTGGGAKCELGIDGESAVELGANTEFTVASLERKTAAFDLGLGSLIAKIKVGLFGEGGEMDIRTASAVAAVRGTEFGVEETSDGGANVGVFDEGHVAVRGAAGGEVMLAPNQETSVLRGQHPQLARALRRFVARRRRIRFLRGRIAVLRRRWAALPPAQRRALRQRIIARRRKVRQLRNKNKKTMREIMEERRRRHGR